jgi:hypothetical protein
MKNFKQWLHEQQNKYFEVQGKFDYEDFEKLMKKDWDKIGWSGDTWIVPTKVLKSFNAACKKLKLKCKEVK